MKKGVYSLVIFSLLTSPAFAAEDEEAKVRGSIEAGYRVVDDQDNNRAHFIEFKDRDDDFFTSFDLSVQKGSYYLDFMGNELGLNDQSYLLKGTNYGKFSYEFFYEETPHNMSFDAKAPYTGIGSQDLDIDNSTIGSVADWSSFDYSVDRKEFGAQVEISMDTPFYVNVGVQRRQQDGIKPLGGGSFWLNMEMPEPVDYTTDDITFQGGYRNKNLHASVQGYWSTFDNTNKYLTQPNTGESQTLPPDNDYRKLSANLSWRGLPYQSMLAVRTSYSKIESHFSVDDLNLTAPAALNTDTFDGDVTYTQGSIALSSRPIADLDTKIYFNFLDKENDSSVIRYQDVRGLDVSNADQIFDYEKNNAGLDVGYDLARHTKLAAGYEYLDVDRRNRDDAEANTDHSLFFQIKNTSLDFLTAKLRYKRLERNSDFDNKSAGVNDPTDEDYIKRYIRRYDATDKSMDEIKLSLEIYPMDQLDFGFEYAYKINDYDETNLGLTEDKHHEFYADFVWRAAKKVTLSGFAGYEMTEADSSHRQFGAGDSASIDAVPTSTSFNWSNERDDDFITYGLAINLPDIIEKVSLNISWQYQESDGEINFSSQDGTLEDINQSDDYDKQELEIKAIYALRQDTDITLGYLYEKYDYDDLQYDDYEYSQTGSYLTGAYYEQSYEANVGYLMVAYRF
ncbi:MAG: MtrB/PioB family outer membrane beta-barrel protein [Desulfobulbaceae bacterium]|nr:MtrB/PioB family outer membrane beta-barrel protein [Desulfobulbaceae bacterium]